MFKRGTQTALAVTFAVMCGCVAPDAVENKLGAFENRIDNLENIVDQKANADATADRIDSLEQIINQVTKVADELISWQQQNRADTINFGGANWVVVGAASIVLLFLLAGLVGAYLLFRYANRARELLTVVTTAVKESSSDTQSQVKGRIKEVASPATRQRLTAFTKAKGTFVE